MSRATSTTVGVLVGGAVGAIAALLLAPKRGEEMRSDLMQWTREKEHKAADRIRQAGSSVASNLRQMPAAMSQKAPELIERAKSRFQRGAEHTAHMVESTTEKAAESMEKGAEQTTGSEQEHSSQQIPIA
ncbi:MAG TPA: YtxH domain-containing protein [Armatimonadetes bacterium]|nr:YtxH domain-containing protein [Armatimonadota bacterium]